VVRHVRRSASSARARARFGGIRPVPRHRTDVPALLGSADVFCLPTELEPFGLVFLEAIVAGLPVVALNSGRAGEIVEHGVTGLLCAPGDVEQLARNLTNLIDDPTLAVPLARPEPHGRARALAQNGSPRSGPSISDKRFPPADDIEQTRDAISSVRACNGRLANRI
jgi:glycosyltransferase involved in cell wall biosynthesis